MDSAHPKGGGPTSPIFASIAFAPPPSTNPRPSKQIKSTVVRKRARIPLTWTVTKRPLSFQDLSYAVVDYTAECRWLNCMEKLQVYWINRNSRPSDVSDKRLEEGPICTSYVDVEA